MVARQQRLSGGAGKIFHFSRLAVNTQLSSYYSIESIQIQSNHYQGVGAVVGGIAGLGLGSLIGGGTGRDVAMLLGAVGGAVAGNEEQKKYDAPKPGQQIIVRTTSGVLVSVTQPVEPGLQTGEKVYYRGQWREREGQATVAIQTDLRRLKPAFLQTTSCAAGASNPAFPQRPLRSCRAKYCNRLCGVGWSAP